MRPSCWGAPTLQFRPEWNRQRVPQGSSSRTIVEEVATVTSRWAAAVKEYRSDHRTWCLSGAAELAGRGWRPGAWRHGVLCCVTSPRRER